MFLGHWHVYKFLCILIWREFKRQVFGPFWHELFPDKKFRVKPRLKTITAVMAYLRLAYPHVRKDIQDSYNNAALPEAARNAFGGLLTLFEWFMPVVSSPLRRTVANCFLFCFCFLCRRRTWAVSFVKTCPNKSGCTCTELCTFCCTSKLTSTHMS